MAATWSLCGFHTGTGVRGAGAGTGAGRFARKSGATGIYTHTRRGGGPGANQQANDNRLPLILPVAEVEARYEAALRIPFPEDVVRREVPNTGQFCEHAGRALSAHPGTIILALIQMTGYEMPQVVAAYTELLDVPGLQWNLLLDRSGGGKSLVVTFIQETEQVRQGQLQKFYYAKHKKELED